jgi:hypothetical protein
MAINCIKLRRYENKTLRGFADLELSGVGIIIKDCPWHSKEGKEWVGFPARSYQKQDGSTGWQPLVEFAADAQDLRSQFQRLALDAIHAADAAQPRTEAAKSSSGGSVQREMNDSIPFAPEFR